MSNDHNNRLFHYHNFKNKIWIPESLFNILPIYEKVPFMDQTVTYYLWKKPKPKHPLFPGLDMFWLFEYNGSINIYDPIIVKEKPNG